MATVYLFAGCYNTMRLINPPYLSAPRLEASKGR